jgi:prevent-host-death family protein
MKKVSIQDLKATLSRAIADAEAGTTVLITRHNEPVAKLGPARPSTTSGGRKPSSRRLKPAVKHATKGRYLAVLLEDRGER